MDSNQPTSCSQQGLRDHLKPCFLSGIRVLKGPNWGGNKKGVYLDHIQHIFLHVLPKTRGIFLNVVCLLRENNNLSFPHLNNLFCYFAGEFSGAGPFP